MLHAIFHLVPTPSQFVSFASVWKQNGIKANSRTWKTTSFSSPQVLVTIPSTTGGNSLLAHYRAGSPSPKQTRTHIWLSMSKQILCTMAYKEETEFPTQTFSYGIHANCDYPGTTPPLLSELEDFSRNNFEVAS